jgi:hypothetical protein
LRLCGPKKRKAVISHGLIDVDVLRKGERLHSFACQVPPRAEALCVMAAADDMAAVLAKLQKKFGVTVKEAALPSDANAAADNDDSKKAAAPKPAAKAVVLSAAAPAKPPIDKSSKAKAAASEHTRAGYFARFSPQSLHRSARSRGPDKEERGAEGRRVRSALPIVFYCNIPRSWSGQVVTFKAHGKGEYRYHSGAFWRGECKAGKRQVRHGAAVCVCVCVCLRIDAASHSPVITRLPLVGGQVSCLCVT